MNRLNLLLEEKIDLIMRSVDRHPQTIQAEQSSPALEPNPSSLPRVIETLSSIAEQLASVVALLQGQKNEPAHPLSHIKNKERMIEGVFTGEKMMGSDGQEYAVPPNYASKSKLVEGDLMKLTITEDGRSLYKQIERTPRKTILGRVIEEEKGRWAVFGADGRTYRVLTASITFYRAAVGDPAVILIAEDGGSTWGAVEQILKES